jgi:predicted DNA-binding transcriptional regulator YafY
MNKLRQCPATFAEIAECLERESAIQGYNFTISKRTFDRDCEDIASIYGIDIKYDFSIRKYRLVEDELPEVRNRFLESLDVLSALSSANNLQEIVHFENRRPQGTEHLHGIVHAILNRRKISFTHQKYWDKTETQRTLEPYALKEFKNRWYVVGKDLNDNRIKSFGLDRMSNLDIQNSTFKMPNNFSVREHYRNCFGIVGPRREKPEEVILSFDPVQGKYIKSMKLHGTQDVLEDTDKELKIKLTVHITFDFVQEILSHGSGVKVLKPASLVEKIKETLNRSLSMY